MSFPVCFFNDKRITVQQIAKSMHISSDWLTLFLLKMGKLSPRCAPRTLMPDHKQKRVNISRTLLTRFQANPKNFYRRLITQDKIWVQNFEFELKIQRKPRKHSGSPFLKKFKKAAPIRKLMASVIFKILFGKHNHDRQSGKGKTLLMDNTMHHN